MSRLYLITGFLGAGKTTFLRNFITLFRNEKVRLIINEFGKEGIDGTLLSDLDAAMKEIAGGSVFCACRLDQFEAALHECGKDETILVEASGLSDPTGVRKLFSQTERFPDIEYMGGICLVDAVRFPKIYATARTCVRQLAASDVVLLNKTDIASEEEINRTLELIKGQRPDMPVLQTSFGRLPASILEILSSSHSDDGGNMTLIADVTTKSMTVTLSPKISAYELEMFIRMFAENTFRVKGIINTRDKGPVLADCVGNVVSVKPAGFDIPRDKTGILNIMSGAKMPMRSSVEQAAEWYPDFILSIK